MHLLQKGIALAVAFSLVGQNLLFAAPTDDKKVPLATVQQQAQQDRTWLQENGMVVALGTYSALATFAAVEFAISRAAAKKQAKTLQQELNRMEQEYRTNWGQVFNENSQLKKQKFALADEADALSKAVGQKDNQLAILTEQSNKKIAGITRSRDVQRTKRKAAEKEVSRLSAENQQLKELYELREATMRDAMHTMDFFINNTLSLDAVGEKQLSKYAEMFNRALSEQERVALRGKLETEAWFKAFSKEEQRDFLKIIDEMITLTNRTGMSREGILFSYSARASKYVTKHVTPSSRYLVGIGRKLLSKSSLLSAAILLAFIAAPAFSAQAADSPLAKRITLNPNLFLDATPEDLAQMEQDPAAYEACLDVATTQHVLTLLDQDEQEEVRQVLDQQKATRGHTSRAVSAH